MELGFLLKKTISVMIMPMSIALFILLVGLIMLYKNKFNFSKVVLTVGVMVLILFSYNPVTNSLSKNLENQYPKLTTIPNDVKHILLLGGAFELRVWEVIRIYKENKNMKIITSGYKGGYDIPEAIRSYNKLLLLGIPKEDIIIHPEPKDTKEEAIKMKKFLDDKPFIIVTAAHHMPRAMGIFKKQGTNPIAAPANKANRKTDYLSFPNVQNLYRTTIVIHEYIGILWAKLRGQI